MTILKLASQLQGGGNDKTITGKKVSEGITGQGLNKTCKQSENRPMKTRWHALHTLILAALKQMSQL